MELIKQQYQWSCASASMAMLLGVPEANIFKSLGHDGSDILWPNLDEPYGRRGFHPQELMDTAIRHGYAMMEIVDSIELVNKDNDCKIIEMPQSRLIWYMDRFDGLILGRYSVGVYHAVAWSKGHVYDPREPRCYEWTGIGDQITVDTFFPIIKL